MIILGIDTAKLLHTTSSTIFLLLLTASTCLSQEINKRGLSSNGNLSDQSPYSYSFTSSFDTLIREKDDGLNYHPLTIKELTRLSEDSKPYWQNDDADEERVDRATQKAFAIQSAHHLSYLVKKSELRFVYKDAQRTLKSIKDYFAYSLKTDGDSMEVSKTGTGKKLLELSLEFNLKQGVDPQLKMGDHMRLRYDYTYDGTFLEYTLDF